MGTKKRCGQCKVTKPIGEFWRRKKSKDGRQHNCKKCLTDYHSPRMQGTAYSRPDCKAKRAAYDARPERRAKRADYKKEPENKAKITKYYTSPGYRAKMRARNATPEGKAKMKAQNAKKYSTPERRAKRPGYGLIIVLILKFGTCRSRNGVR